MYITNILEPHAIPYAAFVSDWYMLMHDNSRSHSHLCKAIIQIEIAVMEWPACSPYLKPIEHLWDQLKQI